MSEPRLWNDPKDVPEDAPVVFEQFADDGWPEDAGGWPLGGITYRRKSDE